MGDPRQDRPLRPLGRPASMEDIGQREVVLEDTDPMPFGEHAGKPMLKVPASYLHYLWTHGIRESNRGGVGDYIKRNLPALRKEHEDGIWD